MYTSKMSQLQSSSMFGCLQWSIRERVYESLSAAHRIQADAQTQEPAEGIVMESGRFDDLVVLHPHAILPLIIEGNDVVVVAYPQSHPAARASHSAVGLEIAEMANARSVQSQSKIGMLVIVQQE